MKHNYFSLSGGKDSLATALVGLAWDVENRSYVFADTGNESQITYDYIDYIAKTLNIDIAKIKADFSFEIMRKRKYIQEKWSDKGVSDHIIERALKVLEPTGNPFLDLCLWKSRFPSTRARFCTVELKVKPIQNIFFPILDRGDWIVSWQGVRAEESLDRRYLPECNEVVPGLYNYRPILKWTAKDVFQAHKDAGLIIKDLGRKGIEPNPLYKQGMGRVGCMPCVNCNKDELKEIARRFPEEIERLYEWEKIVGMVSRRQSATFFTSDNRGHGIKDLVEWSRTTFGGKQYNLLENAEDSNSCVSAYGLCE